MDSFADMKLTEISKLPGVLDLPMSVRAKFIGALRAESEGDFEKAAQRLDAAIEAEEKIAAS
jgi:hypothetical protein